ncbi:MAG: hypothetical protein M3Q69_06010 [Acidobacteriota bacterium]|nr:hypothetical protein [Acidobacteriota bacterium]
MLEPDFVRRVIETFARHLDVRCLWPVVHNGDRAGAARYWRANTQTAATVNAMHRRAGLQEKS